MKTAFTEKTDWRRVGKSKPRCIVIGANNGQGGGATETYVNSVKPLKTYPQTWDGDEETTQDEGLAEAPGAESMAMAKQDSRTEAAVGQKPDTAGFSSERDLRVKDMDTTTITKSQSNQGRYTAISRGGGKSREDRVAERQARSEARKRGRDLHGGLELLELDFLLDMVENIESADEHDILMRKLSFHELARTSRLGEIDSSVLRYYCLDEDGLFDRQVQCEAMKELAARTTRSMGN